MANGILYQGVGKGRFQPLCSCSLVPESGDRIEVVLGKQRCPGIYRPDGRGVRICFSSDPAKRPTSFRPGHNRGVWTLRRPDPLKK